MAQRTTGTSAVSGSDTARPSVALCATGQAAANQTCACTASVHNLAVQTAQNGAATTMAAGDALLCLQVCGEL